MIEITKVFKTKTQMKHFFDANFDFMIEFRMKRVQVFPEPINEITFQILESDLPEYVRQNHVEEVEL